MERYLTNREVMLNNLADLLQFPTGVQITFSVETVGGSQAKIARAVRRILRVVFLLLERLRDEAGHEICVIANPAYSSSWVKNGDACTFSIAEGDTDRYEMSRANAVFSAKGFEDRLKECFVEYDEQWGSRVHRLQW
jgi:hypothetical protein